MRDKLHHREGNNSNYQLRSLNDHSLSNKEVKRFAEAMKCKNESIRECSTLEERTPTTSVGRSQNNNIDLNNTNFDENPISRKSKNFLVGFAHGG
ncbi:hypothetical protein AAZX31_01G040200 [Glycine max]